MRESLRVPNPAPRLILYLVSVFSDDLNRPDLIFTWSVDGREIAVTRAPVIERVFSEARNYNVTVKAHNIRE